MPEFTDLYGMAWKGSIVLGAAWLLTTCLRRRSAAARHLVWTAAMAALLALPVLSTSLPSLRVPALPLANGTGLRFEVTATEAAGGATARTETPAGETVTAAGRPAVFDWRRAAAAAWAAGTAFLLLHMILGHAAIWRVRRQAARFTHGAPGVPVPVLEAASCTMPMTVGIWRTAILMPPEAAGWDEGRRRIVLLHELAHVRRGDLATQFLARLAVAFYWWNPLAWFAWREFVKERERAADDVVLNSGARPSDYAAHLLEVAQRRRPSSALAWAGVAMARPSQLEGRLLAILDPRRNRASARPRAALVASVAAILAVAPFAALRAQDQAVPPDVDATIRAAMAQKNHQLLEQAAGAYEKLHRYDMAQRLLESALTIREEASGRQGGSYAAGLVKLGDLALQRGQYSEAEAFYAKAVALGDSPETAPALIQLGMKAYGQNDDVRAAELFDRALRIDPGGLKTGAAATWLGNVRARDSERAVEAEALYLQAMSAQDPASLEYALTLEFYSFYLRKQARDVEAESMLTRAREIRRLKVQAMTAQAAATSPVYRMGGGVVAPRLLHKVEPAYSPEARAAKWQGTVLMYIEVGTDGVPRVVRVTRGLGLGLDEKAVDAVSSWRFQPGRNAQGEPVTVAATVEVNFRLL